MTPAPTQTRRAPAPGGTKEKAEQTMHELTRTSGTRRRWRGPAGAATVVGMAALLGLSSTASAATPTPGGGASGSVAAITGTSMEVQNANTGQTTVNWTGTTTFSQTVSQTASAVAVGDCLTVTGTPSKTSKTTIAAKTITISAASSTGTCTSGFGGGAAGGGQFGGGAGAGGARPGGGGFRFGGGEGGGSGRPPGGFRGGSGAGGRSFPGANLSIANGKVTSVSGSTVSLSGILLGQFARPSSSKSTKSNKSTKKPTAPKKQNLSVTLSSSTTLTQTQATTAASVAVGDCVSAFGQTASNGAVSATTVRITSSGGKTCTTGFGGFGGGTGGGAGGG
jgi:hypothetical protein